MNAHPGWWVRSQTCRLRHQQCRPRARDGPSTAFHVFHNGRMSPDTERLMSPITSPDNYLSWGLSISLRDEYHVRGANSISMTMSRSTGSALTRNETDDVVDMHPTRAVRLFQGSPLQDDRLAANIKVGGELQSRHGGEGPRLPSWSLSGKALHTSEQWKTSKGHRAILNVEGRGRGHPPACCSKLLCWQSDWFRPPAHSDPHPAVRSRVVPRL